MLLGGLILLSSIAASLLAVHGVDAANRRPLAVDDVIEVAVCAIGAIVAAWLALSGFAAVGCLAARACGAQWRSGERAIARLAPGVIRRIARIGVTATITAGLALPGAAAMAAEAPSHGGSTSMVAVAPMNLGWSSTSTIDPTWQSTHAELPASSAAEGSTTSTTSPDAHGVESMPLARPIPVLYPSPSHTRDNAIGTTVVVLRGDSVWSIAASALDTSASHGEIATEMARWIAANSTAIGENPDLIQPGMELVAPA